MQVRCTRMPRPCFLKRTRLSLAWAALCGGLPSGSRKGIKGHDGTEVRYAGGKFYVDGLKRVLSLMSFWSLRLKVRAFTHLASALPDERISSKDLSGFACVLASPKTANKHPMRVHMLVRSCWLLRSKEAQKSPAKAVSK